MSFKISNTISDIFVMTKRDVLRYIRLPQLLVFNAMLNVVLLLLFNYVFGGAINTGGIEYVQCGRKLRHPDCLPLHNIIDVKGNKGKSDQNSAQSYATRFSPVDPIPHGRYCSTF